MEWRNVLVTIQQCTLRESTYTAGRVTYFPQLFLHKRKNLSLFRSFSFGLASCVVGKRSFNNNSLYYDIVFAMLNTAVILFNPYFYISNKS